MIQGEILKYKDANAEVWLVSYSRITEEASLVKVDLRPYRIEVIERWIKDMQRSDNGKIFNNYFHAYAYFQRKSKYDPR